MKSLVFLLIWVGLFELAMTAAAVAQNHQVQQPLAAQQLSRIHGAQSIDDELARLTEDLELSPVQQHRVLPLLQQHHDRIQVLFDKNPSASREELGPEIHSISAETHAAIHTLLTAHQRVLEAAMQRR
jgi:hypothetical protein